MAKKVGNKERLALPGYYIEFYGILTLTPKRFGVIHISTEGKCKYIHWQWGTDWNTLLWTCAPTKRKVEGSMDKPNEEKERYLYFETHAELLTFPLIHLKAGALVKSPNDI